MDDSFDVSCILWSDVQSVSRVLLHDRSLHVEGDDFESGAKGVQQGGEEQERATLLQRIGVRFCRSAVAYRSHSRKLKYKDPTMMAVTVRPMTETAVMDGSALNRQLARL